MTVDRRVPEEIVAAGSPARVRKTLVGRAAVRIERGTKASLERTRPYGRDAIGDPAHHEFKSVTRRKPHAAEV